LAEIKSLLLEEKTVDYITSKANIIDKEISYQDAITRK
jgi:hypothetical protein